ncbi:hypothetical protein [Burkholderia sp. LMG 13014]|uniref:hypothetical protein n=1 Tax=Burkholderia sp. LMG 13014 TaxID=2709306 RepID=UPI001965BD4A|nr:hypothetical protein [Burkholderia sp. LMG 13014]
MEKRIPVRIKFIALATGILAISLVAAFKLSRASQEKRIGNELLKSSVLLDSALKYDRTRKLDDAATLGDARPNRQAGSELPSGFLSFFESKELNENSSIYKESVSRAVDLMDKKHTLEERIRDARWYKRDGWWQEIQDARQELEPLSTDLTSSLRDARISGTYAAAHLNTFYFPATETEMGIARNSHPHYSTE